MTLFAYYQADTEIVFAVGKTLNELEIDLMRNNNINDIDRNTLQIISISQNDFDRIYNHGQVTLTDKFELLIA